MFKFSRSLTINQFLNFLILLHLHRMAFDYISLNKTLYAIVSIFEINLKYFMAGDSGQS